MAYTPYDWQQTLRQKADYVEDRLRGGSPVAALSCREGVLLLTTRRTQSKIFEIYDRLAFAGLGNPSDLEAVRHAAVDFAHAEGYQRSEQDVSIQRVVGFAISPALKRSFADPFRTPLVIRGLFAQVGETPEEDLYYVLNYDGEFILYHDYAAAAGTDFAEVLMERVLSGEGAPAPTPKRKSRRALPLEDGIQRALRAWSAGRWALQGLEGEGAPEPEPEPEDWEKTPLPPEEQLQRVLAESLEAERVEAALLERDPRRERLLRFLTEEELSAFLP